MKWYLVMAALCLLSASCGSSKKDENDEKDRVGIRIGKYLYVTHDGVLHRQDNCFNLRFAHDENGYSVRGMRFIDTLKFESDSGISYCIRCFDDELYEQVQKIIERNRNKQEGKESAVSKNVFSGNQYNGKSVIFKDEVSGTEYEVKEEYLDAFAREHPDAVTYQEYSGQMFRVPASAYNVIYTEQQRTASMMEKLGYK